MNVKTNLLDLDRQAMEAFFIDAGEKAFRASQVLKWIHQKGVDDFEQMTNLGKALRTRLAEISDIRMPEVVTAQHSADGTRKWLLRLEDGNCIETVFIPEKDRGTLCVSSQVGCSLNCSFCSTARQGYNRNLTVGEIIAQVRIACLELGLPQPDGHRTVSNVVMMGMGEPLLNFDNVISAMRLMMDDFTYGLSKRRVTLSTAGVVPAIYKLHDECDVSLAVSLHAPNDTLRDELVPINRKYQIAELMQACRDYTADSPRRRVTFEYVMLKGVNDSVMHARQLVKVLRDVPAKLNLIPFNLFPGTPYEVSDRATIDRFRDVVMEAGIITVTRKTRGEDIDAACGQLAGKIQDRTRRSQRLVELDYQRSQEIANQRSQEKPNQRGLG